MPSGGRGVMLLALGLVSLLAGCATLPPGSDFQKTVSTALTRPDQTHLGSDLAAARAGRKLPRQVDRSKLEFPPRASARDSALAAGLPAHRVA